MYYLETSALVKLVIAEPETQALRQFLADTKPDDLVTSALTRAELLRVVYRYQDSAVSVARSVLDKISTLAVTQSRLDAAGTIGPPALRTLDAIHLVSALALGSDLTAVVAYDKRLLDAAAHMGLPAIAPA